MEAKERKRIEQVITQSLDAVEAGADEFQAARDALAGCPSYVSRELAVAAIVSTVRDRRRSNTLAVERSAVVRDNWESALTPSGAGVRTGTSADARLSSHRRPKHGKRGPGVLTSTGAPTASIGTPRHANHHRHRPTRSDRTAAATRSVHGTDMRIDECTRWVLATTISPLTCLVCRERDSLQ